MSTHATWSFSEAFGLHLYCVDSEYQCHGTSAGGRRG
jgi:hypothetical protein